MDKFFRKTAKALEDPSTEVEHSKIDLEYHIKKRAKDFYNKHEREDLEKKHDCKLPWDRLQVEIDTSELIIEHSKNCYDPPNALEGRAADSKIVFKSTYNNEMDTARQHQITVTRASHHTATFVVKKGFRCGGNFRVKLGQPRLGVDIGVSSDMNYGRDVQKTVTREITWSANSSVEVPPKKSVLVEIGIDDNEYTGTFTSTCYLSGSVSADVSKDGVHLTKIEFNRLEKIFTEKDGFGVTQKPPERSTNQSKGDERANGKDDEWYVTYVTQGHCCYRYGLQQNVTVRKPEDLHGTEKAPDNLRQEKMEGQ